MMYDVIIYDHSSEQSNDKVIVSDSAEMNITDNELYLELKLYNGSSYIEVYDKDRLKNYAHQRINFKENIIRFDLKKFGLKRSDENIYKNHYSMMNIEQLSFSIDSLEKKLDEKKQYYSINYSKSFNLELASVKDFNTKSLYTNRNNREILDYAINKVKSLKSILKSNTEDLKYKKSIINRHKIEWHRKFSLAFACIILYIIGASLGSIIKKGGFGIPILVSIVLFILYHILNITGEKQVKEVGLDPLIGMWLANLIFTPLSLILLNKATTDSTLLDYSYYKQIIYNLFDREKSNKS